MAETSEFDFDFQFAGDSRQDLLAQVAALQGEPSDESMSFGLDEPPDDAAAQLLRDLAGEVAELGAAPEVLPIEERHFKEHGLAVPARFRDLRREHRFYWVRFPLTLRPAENRPFYKLEFGVTFNPGAEPHLSPVAQMILPNRAFQTLAEGTMGLDLRIGESFELEAASGVQEVPLGGGATAGGVASVEVKAAGQMGFVAGPFRYVVRKAQVNHSPAGTEKVFWTIEGEAFFEEDPVLVVVLRVPKDVKELKIAAALQAYHHFNFGAADLGAVLAHVGERIASFFRKGAPAHDTRTWDLTPRL